MIKDVRIKSGMTRHEVNSKVLKYIILKDEEFRGSGSTHKWMCKCGNEIIEKWKKIRNGSYMCRECEILIKKKEYKEKAEAGEKYTYIRSFESGDVLMNGAIVKYIPYVQVKHSYCGMISMFGVGKTNISDMNCKNCCQVYENSFAHYIEVELGLKLEDVWDFEKNTVNPYQIYKSSKNKVWIKCQSEDVNKLNGLMKKEYHESYEVSCNSFKTGNRCRSCNPRGENHVIHPYDSFGYHNFDKVMSWHPDNDISPFRISYGSKKKVKFICDECGEEFSKRIHKISIDNQWCPHCSMSEGEKIVVNWLRLNNIEYEYEKEYSELIGLGGGSLSYDFYLPSYNMLIEYQGRQHAKYIPGFHKNYGEYLKQLEHDKRKREYAVDRNITLLEIWYNDTRDIKSLIAGALGGKMLSNGNNMDMNELANSVIEAIKDSE